jgi:hypothetical protein
MKNNVAAIICTETANNPPRDRDMTNAAQSRINPDK